MPTDIKMNENEKQGCKNVKTESPEFFLVVQKKRLKLFLRMGYKGFKGSSSWQRVSSAPPNPGQWRCQSDAWPFSWALGGKSCLMSPQ